MYRQQIAALHFNENLLRAIKVGADGTPQVRILFPKYKINGDYTVRTCRETMTFGYVSVLLKETVKVCSEMEKRHLSVQAPPPLTARKRKPCKVEALVSLTSRFKKIKSVAD